MNVPMSDTGTANRGMRVGAPALKKNEDDENDKRQGFKERENDLVNAGRHRQRRVQRN